MGDMKQIHMIGIQRKWITRGIRGIIGISCCPRNGVVVQPGGCLSPLAQERVCQKPASSKGICGKRVVASSLGSAYSPGLANDLLCAQVCKAPSSVTRYFYRQ